MKCKRCKREIEENSIYCNWCGHKQLTDSTEVRVPIPQKRGKKWRAQVTLGEERILVTGDSEEEYYAKARAARSRQIEIKKSPPSVKLGEAIDIFLRDHQNVISPSTLNQYESYRKTRFKNYLDEPCNKINWQRMIDEEAKHYAPKTVKNGWSLASESVRYVGVEVPEVKLPKKRKAKRNWLDYEQIQTFLTAVEGKPYELGALLALNGLRRSELLYLSAEDIDTEKGTINVHGAAVVGRGNKLVYKDYNKNETSTRIVHIVIPRIIDLASGKKGRLITTNPTTLYGSINDVCRKAGLPDVGVHGLRHSYVSLCFHLHVRPDTVMREGGYSNMQTVNEVYRHLAEQDANEDIKRVQSFFATKIATTIATTAN